ncbi:EF hand domain-containing protein [Ditylenchus destructor]|uniref:EF hand domain-containing protein n=1 Tax=Ditylenchus destructor TaxID=166010 RepID=A0AAD4QTW1_9BILA|nr:EF hand domain-containing protein [Ditylenchus destructor]
MIAPSFATLLFIVVFGIFSSAEDDLNFESFDKNDDGKISREEFVQSFVEKFQQDEHQHLSQGFDELDVNSDGYITQEEISKMPVLPPNVFEEFDTNHDGKLSQSEFVQVMSKDIKSLAQSLFQSLDRNKDGYISRDEVCVQILSSSSESELKL